MTYTPEERKEIAFINRKIVTERQQPQIRRVDEEIQIRLEADESDEVQYSGFSPSVKALIQAHGYQLAVKHDPFGPSVPYLISRTAALPILQGDGTQDPLLVTNAEVDVPQSHIHHGQDALRFEFHSQTPECALLRVCGNGGQLLGSVMLSKGRAHTRAQSPLFIPLMQFISQHASALMDVTQRGGELMLTHTPFDDSWLTYLSQENGDLFRFPAQLGFAGMDTLHDDWRTQH